MLGEFILKSCSGCKSAIDSHPFFKYFLDLTCYKQDQKNKETSSKPPHSNQWLEQRIWLTAVVSGCHMTRVL